VKWILIIPGCLIGIIFLVSLLKIRFTAAYLNNELSISIAHSFFSIQVYPLKKKVKKTPDKQNAPGTADSPKKKNSLPISFENALDFISLAADALKRFGRLIKIERLNMDASLNFGDPMKSAMGYGAGCAAVSVLIPKLERRFGLKKYNINIEPAFDTAAAFSGLITLSVRILPSCIAAIILLFKFYKITSRKEVTA